MKQIIKMILRKLRLDAAIGWLIGYGLEYNARNNPALYELIEQYVAQWSAEEILDQVSDKGSGVRINGKIKVVYPKGLKLENNVHIGDNCYFFARGGLTIGENTHISRNVAIYTGSHRYEGNALPYDAYFSDKPVRIGRNVWIGMNVNIIPGVTIGEGSVLAMGVTVTRDVPPFSIVGTQTERALKERDKARYLQLDKKSLWSGKSGRLLTIKEKLAFHGTAESLKGRLFFVLGTGRSGSTTISRALSQHDEIVCKHEPKLELVRHSTEYAHGEINREDAAEIIRQLYCGTRTFPDFIYGESDQKLSNFVEVINQVLPEAKFIWLIRNPIDTINSMYSRGWFSDEEVHVAEGHDPAASPLFRDIFTQYRIQGDKAGAMTTEEWHNMSAFARNCWYWSYWNRLIERQFQSLPKGQLMMVRLEELDQKVNDVLDFLGVSSVKPLEVMVANRAFSNYQLKSKDNWSDIMRDDFERICLEDYKRWYPDKC